MFTAEQRAKGLQKRMENKARRDAAKASKIGYTVETQGQPLPDSPAAVTEIVLKRMKEETNGHFDWEEAPLMECINRAAEMKREYERVAQIIVRRQNPVKNQWTCWTQEAKKDPHYEIPKKVLGECLRHGDDGKWKFRDDGRFVMENGVRTLRPAFCCNYLCYSIYQKYRVAQKIEAGV